MVTTQIWKNPVHLLAFGLGAGLAPYAPGTAGTLVAIPFYLLLSGLAPIPYAVLVLALLALGVWLCGKTARDLQVHDHPGIVWDEIVGYLITMWLAPHAWYWVVIGFFLFRLFDIWKPYPISLLDKRLGGGWGIMLDDVLAGIYALGVLQLLAYVARSWF